MKRSVLILGFFDGIHSGHRKVIESAVEFSSRNDAETVMLTFPKSPAEHFNIKTNYIYSRKFNYKLIKILGVNCIEETDFSDLVNISAEDYLKYITDKYSPMAIFTGFNYTFGAERKGSPELLKNNEPKYNYKYFCSEPVYCEKQVVSSTLIKKLITEGNIQKANAMLGRSFSIKSEVIEGEKIGRTLGFPTANMKYPENIVKLPYGVYKTKALNQSAILNWGIKPTFDGQKPVLEVHIPNFSKNLYGEKLEIEILEKIRDEKRFNSLEELKQQIKKDTEECLK